MSQTQDLLSDFADLSQLLGVLVDGQLTDASRSQLLELLRDNPTAREYYLDYMEVHARLQWRHKDHAGCGATADELPNHAGISIGPAFVPVQPSPSHLPSVVIQAFPSVHSSVPSFLVSYLMALIIVGAGLLVAWMWKLPDGQSIASYPPSQWREPNARPKTASVGCITGMVDCVWEGAGAANQKSSIINQKSLLQLGDTLSLRSGLMEITYDTGAKVILEGPATYEVESAAGGYLSVGKLTAKLEKQSEVGGQRSESSNQKSEIRNPKSFAVRTPTATVTDLGTEFGVEVDERGNTTSHVFRGLVTIQPISAEGKPQGAARVMHEYESVRVESGKDRQDLGNRLLILTPPVQPDSFVRELPKRVVRVLDLVDIVAGGDGLSGRRNAAIDPTNGATTDKPPVQLVLLSDKQYHRVPSLPFVDGVFIPAGKGHRVQIDSAGHTFDGFGNSDASTSDYIWAIGALPSTPEFGPLRFVSYSLGDVDYASAGHGALFLHANKGITFDLDAIRRANPDARLRRFVSVAGITACPLCDIRIFLDGQLCIQYRDISSHLGAIPITLPLHDRNRFLTLTATDGDNGIGSQWIVLGDPRLEMTLEHSKERRSVDKHIRQ